MSELILIDRETKRELGRRQMEPQDRYQLYADCANHAPLCFAGRCYTLHSVAWKIPDQDCIASVSFQSLAYVDD